MIDKADLRTFIREYCDERNEQVISNIKDFQKILNEIRETEDYEKLKEALLKTHSGKNILRFHAKTTEDLKNLWEKFIKEVLETPPEKLLEDIDERFKRWKQIKGAGKGLISEVLAFYYPEYFAPWNNVVEWYFTEFGWGGKPEKYSEVLKHLGELRDIFKEECRDKPINFIVVDYFGWWLKNKQEENKIPQSSQENKREHKLPSLARYFEYTGYYYPPPHLVAQFYTALKTKGFVILSGLTGTGKTKIAQELAELLDPSKENFIFLSVRPDWRDSKPLLGYYNPLLTDQYQKTPLLDLLLRATHDYKENGKNAMPYFVLLDEMNLAHVEYYFADFLSVLESGRDENGFTRESIKLHDVEKVEEEQGIPKEIKLPPNLYIIGTVNMDETTYSFSPPKVLDRAFTVEFHDVELKGYPPETAEQESSELPETLRREILNDLREENGKFLARSKEEINKAVKELKRTKYWNALENLNQALEPYDLHFGYRVVDEIALFFKKARESQEGGIVEFKDEDEIFDLALLMKVLPKFHGNRRKLEKPLLVVLKMAKEGGLKGDEAEKGTDELWKDILGEDALKKLVERIIEELGKTGDYKYRHTARKVLRMLRQLYEIGFASFS